MLVKYWFTEFSIFVRFKQNLTNTLDIFQKLDYWLDQLSFG